MAFLVALVLQDVSMSLPFDELDNTIEPELSFRNTYRSNLYTSCDNCAFGSKTNRISKFCRLRDFLSCHPTLTIVMFTMIPR